MRARLKVGWAAFSFMVLLTSMVSLGIRKVSAAGNQPPGPDRFAVIMQKYTSYEWWLTSFTDDQVVCTIDIDHKGLPTGDEIFNACGQDVYDEWKTTDSCPQDGTCHGYYLQLIKSVPSQRKVGVKLPAPVVWVTLDGCVPYKSTFRCDALPTLVLTGEEPLNGEHITGLAGDVNGIPFTCDPVCQVDLVPTEDVGTSLEFWAFSSYGDSSEIFQAQVRVVRSSDPSDQAWYADVISSQWRGDPLAGCSQIWDKFPTVGGTPDWLSTPQRPEDLATNVAYEYLAANLITHGLVDVSTCDGAGLLESGFANPCGLEAARPVVNDWQNRFDDLIFLAARQTGVSAKLLKNIFARESQFWPGLMVDNHLEAGFGQMTEGGADTLLTWNSPFYEQFCSTVLDQSVCKTKIYPNPESDWTGMGLSNVERSLLTGALVKNVDAMCPDCSMGIDLKKADSSIGVFTQTLLASCKQTGQVVDLNYGTPSESASYEDLWRFTLVDYNAGPGCLGLAVDKTSAQGETLDWANLSSHLTPACQGAVNYVNDIAPSSP
jgi:hypothetical protein